MGVLRQSCGADLSGGLASVNVSGCLSGFGTSISPISITIDPTGLLTCGAGGLRLLNSPTGVGGLSFVTVTGCLTGSGTPTSPLSITLNPTGGLNCTISGLALQQSYLTQVITSGCFDGIGTVGSPLLIKVDPTGLITCGAAGIKLLNAPVASITTTGCLTGSGTIASPLSITLNPTGSIHCTPGGLALQIDPTGLLGYGSNGIKLLNSPVASVTSTGCLSGSGVVGSPLTLNLNPTGGIHCTSSGLALQQTYLTQVITSGCFDGIGTVGSPLLIRIDPTGLISCGSAGIKLLNSPTISITTTGCLSGSGIVGSPLTISLNPTGGLNCTSSGLALQNVYLTQVITSGCFDGIGTVGSPLLLRINPTGLIQCTPNGIAFNGTTGILNGVSVLGCISGNGLTVPLQIKIDPTGLLACGNDGLRYIGPTGGVGGLPAAPINSVQFNQSGLFGGSANFTWDNNNQILNVTGTMTAKNMRNVVYPITDGPSVDINPNDGGIQTWTLTGSRTPTATSFLDGQSVTLMIDDGSDNAVNWSTINPTWIDGSAPTLKSSGYSVIELWKAGSTIYGAYLASGVAGGTTSPALPYNSVQFNNGGSFGGSSGMMWNATGLILSNSPATGIYFSVGRSGDATPLLEAAQYADFISARYVTVRGEGVYLAQDASSNRLGLMGQFGIRVASNLHYGFSDSTSGVSNLDLTLFRDTADAFAQRRLTNAQKFSVYKTYTSLANYERGTLDWQGSPGTFRIGTEQAGTGTSNPVHLITSGTPRIEIAANGQVQFNQAYTFPTGLGASGQTLVNNGAGFLDWGTSYVYSTGCITGSGSLASPLQVKLDPTGLLACGSAGLRYIGPTGGVAGLPAAPNTSIQFNDGGLFGGSSRLTYDGTIVGLSGAINVSGATLTGDSAHILAQRNGASAQGSRIYNTYTNGSNYERGIIDWAGSPGVLQIGTQHAGTGTAKPIQIVTSGTPRIEIAANGNIQFYSAYTFPNTDGSSGQFLRTNGAGLLTWNTPTGGTGSPASPDTSIQFNNAGAFGGSANLTWDGTNLKLIGGGIQIDGTSNLYPMLTNSTSTTNEMQIRLADDSDLANLRVNFMHIGGVSGIRLNAAGSGIGVITNNLGLDFQRFCFGGSTNQFPAFKKVGTVLETRLADDSAYTTLRASAYNLSTDIALERDAADTLAQRRSTNAQKLSVYNTYTSSVDYERAVIDFKGSPGVLRIGTEQQGLGVANPIDIITSGTPRISIAALGNIQFNQAYTFPTGVGSSGQTFVNNGTSTLIWGLPSVRATGCLTGSGTLATPLQLLINPTGYLHCTPLGLAYNGPTGVGGGGGGLTYVTATGCISGSGTTESPISIALNPTGGISCGANGLYLSNSGLTYIVTSTCLAGSGTTASPARISLNPTGLINCTANGLAFSGPTGILFNGVQTFGCISGNGTTNSIGLKVDPTGLLTCGANGIRLSNAVGAGSNSLHLDVTGGATHANPTTAVDLVFNNGSSGVTIDFRPLIYFNMGQAGILAADGSIDNQPRFIVPEGFQMEICRAYLTIGQPGSDTTTVQLQRYVATEDCTEPGTNGTPFSKDITTGCTWQRWDEVEGLTLGSLTHLTFRVLTPGTDAENLVAHFWARVTVCFEP